MGELVVFSGSSNPDLSLKIADYLDVKLGERDARRFSDGEFFVKLKKNVRGADVFIIQPTCSSVGKEYSSVDNNLMELLIAIDACRRASAKRITAVMPYFGYARQDRKSDSKTPISARLVADLIEVAGADRVLSMDLHADQIQGFFKISVDNLQAMPVIVEDLESRFTDDLIFVSPDAGGAERTRKIASHFGVEFAIVDKRRPKENVCEAMRIIGDVKGKIVVLLDDMTDTAGSLFNATEKLIEEGAIEVHAICSHAVLSGPAISRIESSQIKTLTVTDSIPLKAEALACDKIRVVSVSMLFAKAIRRIHEESSLSELFRVGGLNVKTKK
jgi:ribose-phosphate pyrophosphokinase